MSLSKRLLDLAKANLNALLDKAAGNTTIDELTDAELEAELQQRRERRERMEEERRRREQSERAARARGPAPRTAPRNGSARHSPRMASLSDKRLRELYAQLEAPYGASLEEVKKSFHRLMRRYHPDLHIGNPHKHKTATELTMSLTQAFDELEKHLNRSR